MMMKNVNKIQLFIDSLRFGGDALDHVGDVLQVADQAEDVKSGTRQIPRLIDALFQTSD